MRTKITRISREKDGIFGVLTVGGVIIGITLEHNEKAIPADTYFCERDKTGKQQYWKLVDVEGRSNIEIHAGNIMDDTEGCILIGKGIGEFQVGSEMKKGVIQSRLALDELLDLFGNESFYIDIEDEI